MSTPRREPPLHEGCEPFLWFLGPGTYETAYYLRTRTRNVPITGQLRPEQSTTYRIDKVVFTKASKKVSSSEEFISKGASMHWWLKKEVEGVSELHQVILNLSAQEVGLDLFEIASIPKPAWMKESIDAPKPGGV